MLIQEESIERKTNMNEEKLAMLENQLTNTHGKVVGLSLP